MINENRLHHILAVARKAYSLAKAFHYDEVFARKCFALGWNHDIGYEFDPENHAEIGSNILSSFDDNNAIRFHSIVPEQITLEWFILALADMTTSPTGKEVSLDERLQEIENRYGTNHIWYKHSLDICNNLKALIKNEGFRHLK